MEIETAGINQSVDMGDADTSQAVFVDEEEEEGQIEIVENVKEEEVAAVEEATSIVTVPREKILLPIGCTNIDEVDENDPQWVTDYVNSIFTYLRENEVRLRLPHHNYMEVVQTNLTPSMRGILVDWLVEVAEEYELSSETLFLAVNYLDRFAATCPVDRRKFQLVGVACMLIASKYEGIFAPAVDEFVYISANTYPREEVLLMEVAILNALNFTLTAATPKVFLRRYLKAAGADLTLAFLASYLCEISLLEYSFLQYLPSMVASASVFLALRTLGREPWTPTLEFYTSYQLQDPTFQQCVRDLYQLQVNAPKGSLQAIHEKYAHQRFQKVSKIAPPQVV
jgi:cyclin A